MIPPDLLREYATLLDEGDLTTMTESAGFLDEGLTDFLMDLADEEAGETESVYDLFMLTARTFFAIHMAHHDGAVDQAALNQHVMEFGIAVGRELAAYNQAKHEGAH